ncbi:MAG: glycerophosphodiester phosphodiesterase [Clostridiales bacterium]|nr:glycerophosphodiester phosphodiesterase [Clostridiales bacterium]
MEWLIGLGGAALALVVLYGILVAPGRAPADAGTLWRANYAHRGLHSRDRTVPENSLAAFSAAADAGYGMELDIQLSADGQVVVFHDGDLRRVCGVDRRVDECTLDELRGYPLHGTQERIPLFSEMLSLVDGRVPLIVELKNVPDWKSLCEKAAAILDRYEGPCCIESFHPGIVAWFRRNRPGVVRGQLSAGMRSFRSLPPYQRLLLSQVLTNVSTRPHFVAYRHEDARGHIGLRIFRLLGGRLVAWTVRSDADAAYCDMRFDTMIFEFISPPNKKERGK